MSKRIAAVAAVLLLTICVMQSRPAHADEQVDLLLVLAADVSRSLDERKFRLQRDGYAAAIANARVVKAMTSGPVGRIALCFLEWSGEHAQRVIVDWASIGDARDAESFASRVREAPRPFFDRTSISGGIDFAMGQLARSPFLAARRIIDVSGDGTNNSGRDVGAARDDAVARGVTINGLVILSDEPLSFNPQHTHPPGGLTNYYQQHVVGGPGAFVVAAENFDSFGKSIVAKLIMEISELVDPRQR